MKAALFDYQRHPTLDAALADLADPQGVVVKVMGGSQSLGPMLNLRLARPGRVVDVSALSELREVREEGDGLWIGAAVTHAQIEDGVFPLLRGTLLAEVAPQIAYRAIRNRGTLGGSLAHADPAADWVLTAFALDGQVEVLSARGRRRLPMEDFMLGAYTTALADDEMIAALWIPRLSPGASWNYHKQCRKTGEFAEASCAAVFDPERGVARIVLGALDGPPRLLAALSRQIAAQGPAALTAQALAEAVKLAAPDRDSVDRKLSATVLRRCLEALFQESSR